MYVSMSHRMNFERGNLRGVVGSCIIAAAIFNSMPTLKFEIFSVLWILGPKHQLHWLCMYQLSRNEHQSLCQLYYLSALLDITAATVFSSVKIDWDHETKLELVLSPKRLTYEISLSFYMKDNFQNFTYIDNFVTENITDLIYKWKK